jgi:hypothetical protein
MMIMRASALVLACLLGGALANSALRGKEALKEPPRDSIVFWRADPSGEKPKWSNSYVERVLGGPDEVPNLPLPDLDPRFNARFPHKSLDAQDSKVNLKEAGPAGGIQYDDNKFTKEWRNEWAHGDYPSYKKTASKETFPGREAIVAAADSQSDGKISPGLTGPNVGAYLKPMRKTETIKAAPYLKIHSPVNLMEHFHNDKIPGDDGQIFQTYDQGKQLDTGNQGRNPLHYHGTPLMGWGLPAPDYDHN